jgi:hypothetical protein
MNAFAMDPTLSAYVIEFPSDISLSTTTPTCTNVSSCVYYPDTNSMIIIPNAAGANANPNITIAGITNPPY